MEKVRTYGRHRVHGVSDRTERSYWGPMKDSQGTDGNRPFRIEEKFETKKGVEDGDCELKKGSKKEE